MQSLRRQLLLSHLLLIGLMLVLLLGGIARFFHLGRSIDRVLDANVKSVLLMQQTKDALTAQPVQLQEAAAAIYKERANITEPGEKELVDTLQETFLAYRAGKSTAEDVHKRAQAILELNLAAIRQADTRAKADARQSALLGSVATICAALFAGLLARRAVRSALSPLASLAHQAQEIGAGRLNQHIELGRSDEIGTLAHAFNEMSMRLAEARKALEARLVRAERRNDAALESLYDPVIITDNEGCIVHVNREAERLLGSALGNPIPEIRIAQAVATSLRENRTIAEEDTSALVTLQERTYRLRVSPLQTDEQELFGSVAVLEDITFLREVDRLKSEFIGVASHELRTPVTSLLLSVQLLEEGALGALTPPQAEVVAAQRADLLRLERLLHDLLDLARLESGATPPQCVLLSPRAVLVAALDGLRAEASAKRVQLVLGEVTEQPISADRGQIERVLTNLIGNALRHTPSGGRITVSALAEWEQTLFVVEDTGSGIPSSYLPHIFERFTQVPGATRGGAGLGLSLARALVEAHEGTITAESAGAGCGSRFTVTLPRRRVHGKDTNY